MLCTSAMLACIILCCCKNNASLCTNKQGGCGHFDHGQTTNYLCHHDTARCRVTICKLGMEGCLKLADAAVHAINTATSQQDALIHTHWCPCLMPAAGGQQTQTLWSGWRESRGRHHRADCGQKRARPTGMRKALIRECGGAQ